MALGTVGALNVFLGLDSATFHSGLSKAARALAGTNKEMKRHARDMESAFKGVRASVLNLKTGLAALGAAAAVRQIAQAGIQYERMASSLRAASGSAQQAARDLEFVRQESQRLGLDLRTAGDQFASLAAAARGTSLQGQATRDIFTAVSQAMTVLGRSSDETSGALLAVQQIISKGTVSAEELRGQLGERLPGAFNIAARSIGVTTQQLDAMLRAGEITASDFLPRFAKALQSAFGPEAERAAQGFQAQLNRLNTAVFDLTVQVGQSGLLAAMNDVVRSLTEAANGSKSLAAQIGAGLAKAVRVLGEAVEFAVEHQRALIAAFVTFLGLKAAATIWQLVSAFTSLVKFLRAAETAQKAFNVAFRLTPWGAVATAVIAIADHFNVLQKVLDLLDRTFGTTAAAAENLDSTLGSAAGPAAYTARIEDLNKKLTEARANLALLEAEPLEAVAPPFRRGQEVARTVAAETVQKHTRELRALEEAQRFAAEAAKVLGSANRNLEIDLQAVTGGLGQAGAAADDLAAADEKLAKKITPLEAAFGRLVSEREREAQAARQAAEEASAEAESRAEALNSLTRQVEQQGRLAAAMAQGSEAHDALARSIEIENQAADAGFRTGTRQHELYIRLATALADLNDETERAARVQANMQRIAEGALDTLLEEHAQAAERMRKIPTQQVEAEANLLQKTVENALDSMQSTVAGFFDDVLSGAVRTWGDLWNSFLAIGRRAIAEIAAAMIFRPVIMGFGGAAMAGAGSAMGAGGISAGVGAIGGLTSAINALGAKIGFGTPATLNTYGVGPGGVMPISAFGRAGSLTAASLSQVLGYGGLGALGGGIIGPLLGLGGTGSAIGGGLGAAIGTAVAGPIGAAVGGVLAGVTGGIFGKIFGGGKPERPKIRARTSAFETGFEDNAFARSPFGFVGASQTSSPLKQQVSDAFAQFLAEFDEQVAEVMSDRQKDLAAAALQATDATRFKFVSFDLGEEGFNIVKERLETILKAVLPKMIKTDAVFAGLRAIDEDKSGQNVQELIARARGLFEFIQQFKELTGVLEGAGPKLTPFLDQLNQLTAEFDQARATAEQFGLDVRLLDRAQKVATDRLRQDFVQEMRNIATGAGGQAGAAMAELVMRMRGARDEAREFGVDLGLVAEAFAGARRAIVQQFKESSAQAFGLGGTTFGSQFQALQQTRAQQLEEARQIANAGQLKNRKQRRENLMGTVEAQYDRAVRSLRNQLVSEAKSLAQTAPSLEVLNHQMDKLAAQARKIGASEEELAKIRANGVERLKKLEQQAAQGSGNLSIEAARNAVISIRGQFASAAAQAMDFIKNIVDSLSSFQRSITVGDLSGLEPQRQFEAAQREFRRVRDLALGGDFEAQQLLPEVGQAFLEEARSWGASPGLAAAFAEVSDAVAQAIAKAQEQGRELRADLPKEVRRMADEQHADNLNIIEMMRELKDEYVKAQQEYRLLQRRASGRA